MPEASKMPLQMRSRSWRMGKIMASAEWAGHLFNGLLPIRGGQPVRSFISLSYWSGRS